jgi:hypothetical protein
VTQDQVVTILVAVLVPVVTAAAGVLGVMFQDWRRRRTQVGRRRLAFTDASRQVAFAIDWWNAKKTVTDSPDAMLEARSRAAAWLEEASARVAGSELPISRRTQPITIRRLLLFYPIHGRAANIIRGAFFFSLCLLIVGVGGTITDILGYPDPTIRLDYILLIIVSSITLGLRFWAVSVQKKGPETRVTLLERIRRGLLFYRLHNTAANIIRMLFYAWIVFAIWVAVQAASNVPKYPSSIALLIGACIAGIGIAVGLHHWAAAQGMGQTNDKLPSDASPHITEATFTEDQRHPVADHQPDHHDH